jgi:hypothetical protein
MNTLGSSGTFSGIPCQNVFQLALFTLLVLAVLAVHALLLLGLPFWMRSVPAVGRPSVFLIRTILPRPLQSAAAIAVATPELQPPTPKLKPAPHPPQHRVPDAKPLAAADDGRIRTLPLPPDSHATGTRLAAPPTLASPHASAVQMPRTPDSIPPARLPRSAQIAYQAIITQGGRVTALASTIDWRHDGQSYALRWTLGTAGERGRLATGRITAHGLVPAPASGASLPADALDPISAWIELGALIAGNPAQYPVGSRISLPVAGGDLISRQADYVVVDDGDVAAGGLFEGQPLPALHLVHKPADAHNARIELWLGKLLDYLPVRLVIVQPDGKRLDMTLQSINEQTQLLHP